MKKISLLALLFLISFANFAVAGSGKSILPHWSGASGKPSYIFLSNITNNPINVVITFYGKSGLKLAPSTFTNFSNGNTELAANSSGYVSISRNPVDYGYATVEWSNIGNDDDTFALVGHGFRVITATSSTRSDYSIAINDGKPF